MGWEILSRCLWKCNVPRLVRSWPPLHPWPQPPHLHKGPGGSLLGKGPTEGTLILEASLTFPPFHVVYQALRGVGNRGNGARSPTQELEMSLPPPPLRLNSPRKARTQRPDICFSCRHLCLANIPPLSFLPGVCCCLSH